MPPDGPASTDPLTPLPPERRQHKPEGIVLYACCSCCCCCCLHTIGGAIGVALSGNYRGKTRDPEEFDDEFDSSDEYYPPGSQDRQNSNRRLPSIQGLFWTSLLIVIFLQVVIGGLLIIVQGGKIEGLLWGTPCGVIMLGPVYFLAACLVVLFRVGVNPALRRDGGYFRATLRIFSGTLLGSFAGLLIMGGPLLVIWAMR